MYGLYFSYLPEFFKIHSVIMLFYELEKKKSLFYKYGDDTYLGYNDSVCDTHWLTFISGALPSVLAMTLSLHADERNSSKERIY